MENELNIRYRATSIPSGELVYGAPHVYELGMLILGHDYAGRPVVHTVDPNTLCELVGWEYKPISE